MRETSPPAAKLSPSLPLRDHGASEALGLWEPKRSLTLEAARRHTQMIAMLRKVLMGLAAVMVIVLGFQFAGNNSTTFDSPSPTESVKMVSPRYSGRTADGLPFYLTADTATRTLARRDEVALINPVLEFIRADGAAASFVMAETGTFDDINKELFLSGSVNLETDDGYSCQTTQAQIFARAKRIDGGAPIACSGTFGDVNGQAFEINKNYTEFVFKDGVNAKIYQVYSGGTTNLFAESPDKTVTVKQGDAGLNARDIQILRREATSDADGSLRLGEVNKIIATDNFLYQTPETNVAGDQGVYERDKSLITVTGNVRVRQPGGNVALTERLVYNTTLETVRFSGQCQGQNCDGGGRTRFTINSQR